MARRSEEGTLDGFGWLEGDVRLFKPVEAGGVVQLPHMGWNDVTPVGSHPLFKGLSPARFYFLHSYYFKPAEGDDVLASADYHGGFACAVARGHIMGVQFHPEKSHGWGTELLRNFAHI
jgi:glutamine amidotransferase